MAFIMEQFERDSRAVSQKFENNKTRIQANLQKKLEARKRQQLAAKKKEIAAASNKRMNMKNKMKNQELDFQMSQIDLSQSFDY